METSFEALRKVQLQERHQPTLSLLSQDFYEEYTRFLDEVESKLKGNFSIEGARSLENAKKALHDIFELRKQKIFFKALKDFQGNAINSEGLAGKEKELYTGLINLLSTVGEITTRRPEPTTVDVEVLADIPAFIGADSKTYGPFKTGQTVCLTKEEATFLKKKGVARVRS